MTAKDKFDKLLKESGGREVSHNKHIKYVLPNGNSVVVSSTPSDNVAWWNALCDLRHALGIIPEHREGSRRPRKRFFPPGRTVKDYLPQSTPTPRSLVDELNKKGLVEAFELEMRLMGVTKKFN